MVELRMSVQFDKTNPPLNIINVFQLETFDRLTLEQAQNIIQLEMALGRWGDIQRYKQMYLQYYIPIFLSAGPSMWGMCLYQQRDKPGESGTGKTESFFVKEPFFFLPKYSKLNFQWKLS